MTELKPYRKDKEGKLQRLPVRHVDSYHVNNEEQDFITLNPKTKVIVHGSRLEERPLDPTCGVKKAFSPTNPFIAKMRENARNG